MKGVFNSRSIFNFTSRCASHTATKLYIASNITRNIVFRRIIGKQVQIPYKYCFDMKNFEKCIVLEHLYICMPWIINT